MAITGNMRCSIWMIIAFMVPIILGPWAGYNVASFFYGISLSLQSVLTFLLPFLVFIFLLNGFCCIRGKMLFFSTLLLLCVFTSNLVAIFFGGAVGYWLAPRLSIPLSDEFFSADGLTPLWTLDLPFWFSSTYALLGSIIVGMVLVLFKLNRLQSAVQRVSHWLGILLRNVFFLMLPLMVFGFAFKLQADGILQQAFSHYLWVLLLVVMAQILYITLYFLLSAGLSVKLLLRSLRNIFPACLTGFSSISSVTAIPALIHYAEKNDGVSQLLARASIPVTVNIHTIGSAIALTILGLVTLNSFNQPLPGFGGFILFAFCYALAKFSVIGIPGGIVLIAGPLLQSQLHFSNDMVMLMIVTYIVFDPFGTAANVAGNGAFTVLAAKAHNQLYNGDDSPGIDDVSEQGAA